MSDGAPNETSSFNEFFGEFSEIPLHNQGTDGDVVVSSRVRLVRNIAAYPFPGTCSDDQQRLTAQSVQTCLTKLNRSLHEDELVILPSEQLEELERQFLIEFQSVIDAGIVTAEAVDDFSSLEANTEDPSSMPNIDVSGLGADESHSEAEFFSDDDSRLDAEVAFEEFDDETVFDLDDELSDISSNNPFGDSAGDSAGGSALEKWNVDGELMESAYRDRMLQAMEDSAKFCVVKESANDLANDLANAIPTDDNVAQNVKTAIVVNNEDHVRLQGMATGLSLNCVWQQVDRIDDLMEQYLSYAFSPQWGYLTSCPANVGTGMRVSVVLHLPGLATLDRLDQSLRWLIRGGIAGRGLYGENAWGDFYRIANQPTLGKTEQELLALMQSVVPVIVDYERDARKVLLRHYRDNIEHQVSNAFRALKLSVQRSDEELLALVSSIRLGLSLGLLDQSKIDHIRETFELKRLKQQLEFAVMLEQYSTATKCRDRIRQLEERRHGH